MKRCAAWAIRAPRFVLTSPLVFYRRMISPWIAPRCRYHPTCSTYAVAAIHEYGIFRGTWLSLYRVLRCNPWSAGGLDPLPPRKTVRRSARGHDL